MKIIIKTIRMGPFRASLSIIGVIRRVLNQGISNEYPQHMFLWGNKKNITCPKSVFSHVVAQMPSNLSRIKKFQHNIDTNSYDMVTILMISQIVTQCLRQGFNPFTQVSEMDSSVP